MQPEGIAIQLDRLKVGPEPLKGALPIFIVATQGQTPAGLREEISSPKANPGGPGAVFQLNDIIVVVDRSGSMNDPVTPQDPRSKLNYVKFDLCRLQKEYPSARVRLVTFNSSAELVELPTEAGLADVRAALQNVRPNGGTHFASALEIVERELQDSAARNPGGRRLVLFVTDGHDGDARERARQLVAANRDRNTLLGLVGAGADYEQSNLVDLAGHAGFSFWAHIPNPGQTNVFSALLPKVLEEMTGVEHYLSVRVNGEVAGLYGLSPAMRRMPEDRLYLGYTREGIGLCFARGQLPSLKLQFGSSVSDAKASEVEIPIVDEHGAGAHWERLLKARDSLAPFLVLQAQLAKDRGLLLQLRDAYPELAETIDSLTKNMDGRSAGERLDSLSMTGDLGTSMFLGTGERVNDLSQVLPQRGPRGAAQGGHSGGIGPLDSVFMEPPADCVPNPGAYKAAVPRGAVFFEIRTPVEQWSINLNRVPFNTPWTIGSHPRAEIRLQGAAVGSAPLRLVREVDAFYVQKSLLSWRQSVSVNGQPLRGKARLSRGDVLNVGQAELRFG